MSVRPDEELLALPAPPRGQRLIAMTLMAGVVVMAMGLAASLRQDVESFFASDRPTALGDATAVVAAELIPNTYVTVSGTPMRPRSRFSARSSPEDARRDSTVAW